MTPTPRTTTPTTNREGDTSAAPSVSLGVGVTSRWRDAYALALTVVLAIGFMTAMVNPALRRSPDAPVLDGSWAEAYQAAFDRESPLLAPARTLWGVIDTVVFGQGRSGVLVGRDWWLFSREEYETVPQAEAAIERWADRIAAVRDALADQGAVLVVSVVPSKAAIVADFRPAPLPQAAASRYDQLQRALAERDVIVSDVREALVFSEAPFLRTDTHWTPAGAAAAALAIAATVRSEAPFRGLDATPFETTLGEPSERWGDLTTFLDLGSLRGRFGPPADLIAIPTTVSLAPPSTDLFAGVELPVALVGTSYSADPTWNLAGALRQALGSDLLDAAVSGLGPWEPMARYLSGEALRSTPPEVVIWEIPERYLTLAEHVPASAAW